MHKQILRLAALALALDGPATAQLAILQIHVIEGEGAVHPPGSRISRPLVVAVADETGRPVPGAAVSFHLPEDGPTGSFLNGLRTEVSTTDAAGRAVLHGMVLNRTAGRFQVRIVASKEQARAGIVSFQYIAEPHSGEAAASPARTTPSPQRSASRGASRKWLILAAVVGGGAVAGILGGRGANAASQAPASPASPTLTIGPPSTSVVKP